MDYPEFMRILLLILSFCLVFTVQAKDVYRTVDENGNVIFSDTPSPGSQKITVEDIQTVAPGDVPKFEYKPPPAVVEPYSKLEIASPQPDTVIHSDSITVSAVLEPALNPRTGDHLVLYLDGKEAASGTTTQFTLNDIERGIHTLNLVVLDQSGKQMISSPTISFTRFQPSVLNQPHPQPQPQPPPPPPTP